MFAQVSAAKKMLFAPVARDPDFEYGAKFWCYFCELEYGKHKVIEMTTVLAAGLLEHIARYTVQCHTSLDVRKLVFGVSDMVRHKLGYTAAEDV